MNVPETIIEQLNSMDPRALWAWGAKDLVGTSTPSKQDCFGYLMFKTSNCPKVVNGTRIKITLEFNDTYTVKCFTVRKIRGKADYKETIIAEEKDVYFDQLIPVIDNMVG